MRHELGVYPTDGGGSSNTLPHSGVWDTDPLHLDGLWLVDISINQSKKGVPPRHLSFWNQKEQTEGADESNHKGFEF